MNELERMMLELALKAVCPELELRRDEPMSRHTTFRVGGPARLMALPRTPNEAVLAVKAAATQYVTPFFLGNGSNLLVSDGGYDGFVIKTAGIDFIEAAGPTGIRAGAGALMSRIAAFAAGRGLTGLEFASGIPASLGGAVAMNAGAYGGEMKQVVTQVAYLDKNGDEVVISGEECDFSYRHSWFSNHPEEMILWARLELEPGEEGAIRERMAALSTQRREKQPLDLPSAGSTFKRPAPVNGQPVYAAALIDQCGCKGMKVGGAMVSEKHAGFVVNAGGATCADILELVRQVRERVKAMTGVELEPEIRMLGV